MAKKLINILHDIHQQGVIHRDIKPDNIIITDSAEPILIDFGLSAYCKTQRSAGFASQNALNGDYVYKSDDFESLCYTLYALEIGQSKWL